MPIAEVIRGVFEGAVKPILDKIIPDAQQRVEAELIFYKHAHEINLAQIGVNQAEAASSSIFTSGWRPFVGWVCGGSLFYAVVGNDLLNFVIGIVNIWTSHDVPVLPEPDLTLTFEILLGLLGLGAMRTHEKVNGVTS